VLEVIKTFRQVVNQGPCLVRREPKQSAPTSAAAVVKRRRKDIERRMLEELSLYYSPGAEAFWACPGLLLEVVDDLEIHFAP